MDAIPAGVELCAGWEGLQGAELGLLCQQQQRQGMVSVWVVVRAWAGFMCSVLFLEEQQPDLPATDEVYPWCHSWRQVQLSRQGMLIPDNL